MSAPLPMSLVIEDDAVRILAGGSEVLRADADGVRVTGEVRAVGTTFGADTPNLARLEFCLPDGRRMATLTADGTLTVLDLAEGDPAADPEIPDDPGSVGVILRDHLNRVRVRFGRVSVAPAWNETVIAP